MDTCSLMGAGHFNQLLRCFYVAHARSNLKTYPVRRSMTVVSEHALLRVEGISDPKTTKPIDQDSIHPSNKPDVSYLPKKIKIKWQVQEPQPQYGAIFRIVTSRHQKERPQSTSKEKVRAKDQKKDNNCSTAESVERATLAFECVHDIQRRHRLSFRMLSVGDGITNHGFKE